MYSKTGIVLDRREQLRVKIKSLAVEASIIRREERRTHGVLRDELHNHRVNEVRSEARHALLAYGFIRGRSLERMEPKRLTEPNWSRVAKLCNKYGPAGFQMPQVERKADGRGNNETEGNAKASGSGSSGAASASGGSASASASEGAEAERSADGVSGAAFIQRAGTALRRRLRM